MLGRNEEGDTVPRAYEDFMWQVGGVHPLAFSDSVPGTPGSVVENLYNASLIARFQITLRIPPSLDPAAVPDVVVLGNNTSAVTYNLLGSKFGSSRFGCSR